MYNFPIVGILTCLKKNAQTSETVWNCDIYHLLNPKKQDPDTMVPYTWTEKGIA